MAAIAGRDGMGRTVKLWRMAGWMMRWRRRNVLRFTTSAPMLRATETARTAPPGLGGGQRGHYRGNCRLGARTSLRQGLELLRKAEL